MTTKRKKAVVVEESTERKQGVDTSFLKNEKVIVKYIMKPSKDIRDPNHIAYGGKLNGTFDWISPPRLRKDKLKNVLTKNEKRGLEFLMARDLSIYSDFWKGYKRGGLFPIALGKDDTILDLSVPEDYIIYKVLKNDGLVANSQEQLRQKGTYKYIMVKEDDSVKMEDAKVNKKAEAYTLFGAIQTSSPKMRYVLRQFGNFTSPDQKLSFLRGELGKLIETRTDLFIKFANDELLDVKVLIQEGIELGVIRKHDNKYYTAEGTQLADDGQEPTLEIAASFLSSHIGQEARLAIEARIKNARD